MSIEYDRLARIYDELYGPEQKPKHIVIAALLDGAKTILDAGCGTGMLADLVPYTYHVCLDISAGMLGRYVERHRALGDPLRADMSLPPLRCCFDAVVAVTSLHEAPDAVDRLFHLVKPGGLFIVSIKKRLPHPPEPRDAILLDSVEAGGDTILVYARPASDSDSLEKPRQEE